MEEIRNQQKRRKERTMENKEDIIVETATKQSDELMKALHRSFTRYMTSYPDKIMNDGVVILGMAKFAGFVLGKMSGIYHHTDKLPITEFENFFREYAETSEKIFLKKQKRASEGEE